MMLAEPLTQSISVYSSARDNDGQNSTEPGDTDAGTIPSVGILATVVAIFCGNSKRKNEL